MKKASFSFCILIVLAVVLAFGMTSCATTDTEERNLSSADCTYTLRYVLNLATDKAVPALFSDLNSYKVSMVPSDFEYLDQLRKTIPGMDRLLHLWEEDVLSYIMPFFDEVHIYLESMAQNYQFQNPVSMIEEGISSISEDIQKNREDEMAEVIRFRLSGLDTSAWKNVAIQYNTWASSRENLYGEENPRIDVNMSDEALISRLSYHLVDIYIRTLAFYEKLIRTTPDPAMDSVASYVLGLD
ncbi:MAG: hypothetical protein J6W39_05460 [Spirochaetales bacterium]|nr:hypothetical protein [Spirochaetales bacterium]MBP5757012.1 hypothetical protein [Spirochaetales bacterium]